MSLKPTTPVPSERAPHAQTHEPHNLFQKTGKDSMSKPNSKVPKTGPDDKPGAILKRE